MLKSQISNCLSLVRNKLLNNLNEKGFWEGELSSSPLSTAIASFTLSYIDTKKYSKIITKGINWLEDHINSDGGWGDNPGGKSNLSTTLLCWSAISFQNNSNCADTIKKAEKWIIEQTGSLDPSIISKKILKFYKNDKTFSAPILIMCVLANRFGKKKAWKFVPQLPLELAAFPHQFFRWLRLPVVSYAIPALISIGLGKHINDPTTNIILRFFRNSLKKFVVGKIEKMQPINGGFLEAAPLTGFVLMSLTSAKYRDSIIIKKGISFLLESQRKDGSWPIDSNLATWVTSLSITTLLPTLPADENIFPEKKQKKVKSWLLNQQFKSEHPFTHSAPGGWGWTDLPGSAPDADDTAGALLALYKLGGLDEKTFCAVKKGIKWLMDLQNQDGGIPTFCKGWGKLQFDKSCPDITAHALRAFYVWASSFDTGSRKKIKQSILKCIKYLKNIQNKDGAWLPLWFGNQWSKSQRNPVYGTAQVIIALKSIPGNYHTDINEIIKKGCEWLANNQNFDNGWSSEKNSDFPDSTISTIEETALALSALSTPSSSPILSRHLETKNRIAVEKGTIWLLNKIEENKKIIAAPIGLYFASLWYSEKLYPIIFSIAALQTMEKNL